MPKVKRLTELVKNTTFMFLIAILLGFILPGGARYTKSYLDVVLFIIMLVATSSLRIRSLLNVKSYAKGLLTTMVINYGFLSVFIVALAYTFVGYDLELLQGFIVMAAVPVAMAVVPFTYLLYGDLVVSTASAAVLYLISPIVTPMIIFALSGAEAKIFDTLIFLIKLVIIPIIASRIIVYFGEERFSRQAREAVINICIFIVVYSVIGLNRDIFFADFGVLAVILMIAVARTFGTGILVERLSGLVGVDRPTRVSYALFASFKNLALTATMALTLFGERASVPATIAIPFEVLFFLYLKHRLPSNIA